jgi:hypothetical protein
VLGSILKIKSMARINFDYLNIRFQKRYKNKGFKMKENTGLDTETYQGYVKLICADDGDFKTVESFDDIIKFLMREKFRGKYNWFFNIQYDFESIIKYLDYGELVTLYREKELQYNEDVLLRYIPSKYFALLGKNNNNYYFYDMHNFVEGSLNKASKEMLHDAKLSDIVDSKQLNVNWQYWIDNQDNIIKYCIKDALLTKQLADYFWNIIYTNLNFYPKQPMSKGKLSEEYFLHTCNIPAINGLPEKVIKYAYNAYYGGHFEILKRGYMPSVYSYDIKSAYPSIIADLIDFTKGKWEKTETVNESAHSGFYLCQIQSIEKSFSPYMQKVGGDKGLNVYPNGKFKQYLTKEEILFNEAQFQNGAIKIVDGWEFYSKVEVKPFKTEIERLYDWKEKEQNSDVKKCVKIILNSLYGKFIQVTGDYNQTGKLFNPMYAAKITAGARIKILELALQKPETIISFSTDSVCSTEKLKVPLKPQLGDFELDFNGEGVFLMSDVYNLWNLETKKEKTKLRGFSLASSKDIENEKVYLKDILQNLDGTLYKYFSERPDHLGECLAHNKTKTIKDNLNIFSQHEKTININGDNKRLWSKQFSSGKDCLKETHESLPIMMGV